MIKVTKLTDNLNKKQKNLLLRIIAAAVMLVILFLLPLDDYPVVRFLLFLIPYFTVGYDILRKAFKGIFEIRGARRNARPRPRRYKRLRARGISLGK